MKANARLADLCDISSGGTPPRSGNEYFGGRIPWVKIGDIEAAGGNPIEATEEYITQAGLAAIGNRLFPLGSVLLAIYGSVGKVGVAGRALATNQAILGIRVTKLDRLDPLYLRRWLCSMQPSLVQMASGVTQQNISATIVRNLTIPLPPLAEQRRIARMLDLAESARRRASHAHGALEDLQRAYFLALFGDPVKNELNWPTTTLGACLSEPAAIGTPVPATASGLHPVVRVGDLGATDINVDRCARVTIPENSARFATRFGDLLLVRAIGSETHLGKASVVSTRDRQLFYDSHVMRVRVEDRLLRPLFLWHWFRSQGGRRLFQKHARRTAVQFNINAQQLTRIPIPLPPRDLQDKFLRLARVAALISDQLRALDATADELGRALMADALIGRTPAP